MGYSLQTTTVLRNRWQLTIPEKVRRLVDWLTPESVVAVIVKAKDEILIKPFVAVQSQTVDWQSIWEKISLTRSFKGRRGNLADFIASDRQKH